MELQTIEERYVDMKKLTKLLKELFGNQKCEVEVSLLRLSSNSMASFAYNVQVQDEYIVLTIPQRLNEVIPLHLDVFAWITIFCSQRLDTDTFASSAI